MDRISKELRFKDNPRIISPTQLERLSEHLDELGDLSGVVYCRRNKAYAGGNQRSLHFDGCNITLTETYKKPTKTGTVALGYIEKDGERYAYREVDWSEEQFKKACIVANNDGGDWDWSALDGWDKSNLTEWGLLEEEKGPGGPIKKDLQPYRKTHILISFNPELFGDIANLIDQIQKIEGVDIKQGSNG